MRITIYKLDEKRANEAIKIGGIIQCIHDNKVVDIEFNSRTTGARIVQYDADKLSILTNEGLMAVCNNEFIEVGIV